jgi:hypothetical protein
VAPTRAVDAVKSHHALLTAAMAARVDVILAATSSGDRISAPKTQADLVRWAGAELLPARPRRGADPRPRSARDR